MYHGQTLGLIVSTLVVLLATSPEESDAYFGLTEQKIYLSTNVESNDASMTRVSGADCKNFGLNKKQKKMCRRDTGMAEILLDSIRLSAFECQKQFRYERWNCSIDSNFRKDLLKRGFKETAFLYSVSSAGLIHTLARACSSGKLDRCTCDEETFNEENNRRAWMWGGCGDNLKYSQKFFHKFLSLRKEGKDLKAAVDEHNSDVGVRVVRANAKTTCKCHGVSGSCAMKTCWRQLSTFQDVGNKLKEGYEDSKKVQLSANQAGEARLIRKRYNAANPHNPQPRPQDLVYIENSPDFCSKSKYSMGTASRVCVKDQNCDTICCGKGYNIQTKLVKKPCSCRVVWCCYVECDQCWENEEIYLCK